MQSPMDTPFQSAQAKDFQTVEIPLDFAAHPGSGLTVCFSCPLPILDVQDYSAKTPGDPTGLEDPRVIMISPPGPFGLTRM